MSLGLVSYSAYLWHQPLFAFSRHRSLTEPGELRFAMLFVVTFILAYLSWRYIEKPFRIKGKFSRNVVIVFGATGSIALIAIGLAGHVTGGFNGFPFKNQLTQEAIGENWKVNYGLSETCEESFTLSSECRTDDEPEILIWGDSYAMHLVQGIMASNPDAKVIQFTKTACGPFFDVAPVTPWRTVSWAESCLEFTKEVSKWIHENATVK